MIYESICREFRFKGHPMVFFMVFNLGILGDEKSHKYPRDIGLI